MLRLNKINHKLYNPTLLSKQWRKHFNEIINSQRDKAHKKVSLNKLVDEFGDKFVVDRGMRRPKDWTRTQSLSFKDKKTRMINDPLEIDTLNDI